MNRFLVFSWRRLLLIAIIAASASLPMGADAAIRLTTDPSGIRIEDGVFYHIETAPLTPIQAAEMDDAHWLSAKGADFNFGSVATALWLRFDISNETNEDNRWYLSITYPALDNIALHLRHRPDGRWDDPMISGKLVPLEKRAVAHRNHVFPLSVKAKASATVFIRVSTNSSMIIPMKIWQHEPLRKSTLDELFVLGVFYGLLAVMVLYNLFLYLPTRDKSFLFFSLFIFSIIPYTLEMTGLGTRYLWGGSGGGSAWFNAHGLGMTSSLCFLTSAAFIRRYLNLKKYGGWILKMNTGFIIYWAVSFVIFSIWVSPALFKLEDLAGVICSLAGIVTSLYCWIKKDPSARLFTIALSFMSVSTALLVLSAIGILGSIFILARIQLSGFVFAVFLLSIALPERINRERKVRSEAQKKALTLSETIAEEKAEKLRAQTETLALQKHLQLELEARVNARAAELEQAMGQLETANRQLSKLSITDALTNVYNRRYFDQALVEQAQQARNNGCHFSVALADIDHFKSINDQYGHLIGDACLTHVASIIKHQTRRKKATIARYGGEEFGVIMMEKNPDEAYQFAEEIRKEVESQRFDNRGTSIDLRVSIGVATWMPGPGAEPEQMVNAADQALYNAKQQGRNRVVMADAILNKQHS